MGSKTAEKRLHAVALLILATAFPSAPAAGVTLIGGIPEGVPSSIEFSFAIGGPGRENGQFNEPTDVTLDATGRLFVLDSRNVRVQVFNRDYFFESSFGRFGWEGEGLIGPRGIAVDNDLYVYVSDRERNLLHRYDTKGKYLKSYGQTRSVTGQFLNPAGLAVDKTGEVLVADAGNHKVKRLNSLGEVTLEIGYYGSGAGQLNLPYAVAMAHDGGVVVADGGNSRVQLYDRFGNAAAVLPQPPDKPLRNPSGVCLDERGNIFVSDTGNDRIAVYAAGGGYLFSYGRFGAGDKNLNHPGGITFGPGGELFVADTYNHRVTAYVVEYDLQEKVKLFPDEVSH